MLAGPDGTILRYRKIHPFSFAGEHHHYEAGDKHVTVMVEGVRLSLFVCYDLRFGDEFWPLAPRHRLLRGGRELAGVAPFTLDHAGARHARSRTRRTSSAVNRVGAGDGLDYCGDSAIIGPFGEEVVVGR